MKLVLVTLPTFLTVLHSPVPLGIEPWASFKSQECELWVKSDTIRREGPRGRTKESRWGLLGPAGSSGPGLGSWGRRGNNVNLQHGLHWSDALGSIFLTGNRAQSTFTSSAHHPHLNPTRESLLIPFYICGNWGPENGPAQTQTVSWSVWNLGPRLFHSKPTVLSSTFLSPLGTSINKHL